MIKNYTGGNAVIVVSAMGKTTNALEQIVNLGYAENDYNEAINQLYKHHQTIIDDLQIHVELSYFIDLIIQQIEGNRQMTYPQYYDQVVSVGELISSSILSAYLSQQNIANTWMDARTLIATDHPWRTAVVNWENNTTNCRNGYTCITNCACCYTRIYCRKSTNHNYVRSRRF
ncbi:MAG: hypothetical protein IPO24_12550 [Bacteroidetes bacterium]|nr:hypothetical protein [Bacteroidota bacterium]